MWITFLKAMESDIYNSNILKNIKQEECSIVVKRERLEDENEFQSDEECSLMESNMYWMDLLIKNEECSSDVTTKTVENEDEIEIENSTNYRQTIVTNVLRESDDEFSSDNGDLFINEEYSLLTMSEIVGNEIGIETENGGNFKQDNKEESFMKNEGNIRHIHDEMYETDNGTQKKHNSIFIQSNMSEILNKNREIDQKLEERNSTSHRLIYRLHSLYQTMKSGVNTDYTALSSQMADRCAATCTDKNASLQPVKSLSIVEPKKMLEPSFLTSELSQLSASNRTTPVLDNLAVPYLYWAMEGEDLSREIGNSKFPISPNPEEYQVKTEIDDEDRFCKETGNLAAQYADWTVCGEDLSREIQNYKSQNLPDLEKYQDKTEVAEETKGAGISCSVPSQQEAGVRMQTEDGSFFVKNGTSDVFIKKEVEDDIFEEYVGNSICKRMKYEMSPELSFATDSFGFTPILDVRDIPLPPGSPPKQALALQSSNSSLSLLPVAIKTEPTLGDDIPVYQNLEQNNENEHVESPNGIENNTLMGKELDCLNEVSDSSSYAVASKQEPETVNQSEAVSNFSEKDVACSLKVNEENVANLETSDDSIYLPLNRVLYEPAGSSDTPSTNMKDVANILLQPGDPPALLLPPGAVPLLPPPRRLQESPALIAMADCLSPLSREERLNFVWSEEALLEFRNLAKRYNYKRRRCCLKCSNGDRLWVNVPMQQVKELLEAKEGLSEQDDKNTVKNQMSIQQHEPTLESRTTVPCQQQSQCNSS